MESKIYCKIKKNCKNIGNVHLKSSRSNESGWRVLFFNERRLKFSEMDRRRNRRGRGHSHSQRNLPHIFSPPEESKRWSFLGGLYSFVIMTSLIALIYMMLEYHCSNCKENKCDMNNVTKSIDDIAVNIFLVYLLVAYQLRYQQVGTAVVYHW